MNACSLYSQNTILFLCRQKFSSVLIYLCIFQISLYLLNHKGLIENSYKVAKVLEHMCECNMKSHDTNDIMAMKTHYLASVIRQASKSLEEKGDNLQTWIKR